MKNTEIAVSAYGKWDAGDVAYISSFNWASEGESSLTLTTLVQPRLQRAGSWPKVDGPWYRVVIKFEEVREFSLKKFGNCPRQVMGFSIESVKERGMEGLNYHIEDYENGVLEFYAQGATLVSVQELDSSDLPLFGPHG